MRNTYVLGGGFAARPRRGIFCAFFCTLDFVENVRTLKSLI